ncbi:hypothetical protein [Magnetococcus sp. PR-3]|uniref:hypothetical protein n=1 Tax=Magnetococcus sp. PR-3 TaxID=3120355 RepID=UPI002FCE13C1
MENKLELAGDYFLHPANNRSDSVNEEDERLHPMVQLSTTSIWSLSDNLVFNLDGYMRLRTPDPQQGVFNELHAAAAHTPYLDVTQALLTYEQDDYDLSLGKTRLNWGVADLYSPMDQFDQSDASIPSHPMQQGRWMVRYRTYLEDDTLSLVVIPMDSSYAGLQEESRWMGSASADGFFSGALLGAGNTTLNSDIRPISFENATYAVHYQGVREGYDFAASAYYGLSPFPVVYATNPTGLALEYHKIFPRALGVMGGLTYVDESLKYYGELQYQHIPDHSDDDFLKVTLGFAYTESDWALRLGGNELSWTLEWAGDLRTDHQSRSNYVLSSMDARPFQDYLISRLNFDINDTWGLTVGGAFGLNDSDSMDYMDVNYTIRDDVTLRLRMQSFRGVAGSQFGHHADNDYVSLKLSYSF